MDGGEGRTAIRTQCASALAFGNKNWALALLWQRSRMMDTPLGCDVLRGVALGLELVPGAGGGGEGREGKQASPGGAIMLKGRQQGLL